MKESVVAYFESIGEAESAVVALREIGVAPERIGVLFQRNDSDEPSSAILVVPDAPLDEEAESETGKGFLAGGAFGFLAGLCTLAFPGLGFIVVAGPIASTLGATTLGALAGGFVGLLNEMGIPDEEGGRALERIASGGALVTVVIVDLEGGKNDTETVNKLLVSSRATEVWVAGAEWMSAVEPSAAGGNA